MTDFLVVVTLVLPWFLVAVVLAAAPVVQRVRVRLAQRRARRDFERVTAYVTDGGGRVKRGKKPPALVSWCGNRIKAGEDRPRLGGKEASATPTAFRDLLLDMARSVAQREAA